MLTCDGPKVIEFNVRFGDPEAQVVIPMIADDLAPRLAAAADGALDTRAASPSAPSRTSASCSRRAAILHPGRPECRSRGLLSAARVQDVLVFHAGTARRGDDVVTAGGRVLTVVGRGATYDEAIERAYEGVSKISFDGHAVSARHRRKALLS